MSEKHSIVILPCSLKGQVRVPLSKSMLHRSLICAALAGSISLSDMGNGTQSDDISATKACLTLMMDSVGQADGRLFYEKDAVRLPCRESGSTLRFLVPIAAALGIPAYFSGEGRLPFRPLGAYTSLFPEKGIRMKYPGDGLYLPLRISGKLEPGLYRVPGNVSSQYISGLLMALPLLDGDSDIELTTELESEPYVVMTLDVMRAFGVNVQRSAEGYRIPGRQTYRRTEIFRSEPDFSQAAFWLTANYLGHNIEVADLPESSSQGDREIRTILQKMSDISSEAPLSASSGSAADLPGERTLEIDASQIPDLVPILSVAAAATPCTTRILHAERLRLKECDRLAAAFELLTNLGVRAEQTSDGLVINGRRLISGQPLFRSCSVSSFHDHRMVMAAAIAATKADGPVRISDYRAVDKSYPEFFKDFRLAGGIADELNVGK